MRQEEFDEGGPSVLSVKGSLLDSVPLQLWLPAEMGFSIEWEPLVSELELDCWTQERKDQFVAVVLAFSAVQD